MTSLVFQVVPAPTATAFELTWPRGDAAAVISAWQTWAPDAPDEVNASLRLTTVSGRPSPTVSMVGAVLADKAGTMTALGQLVSICNVAPSAVSVAESSYRQVKRTLGGDEAEPGSGPMPPKPVWSKSEFFRRSLPMSVIAELLHTLTSNRPADQSRELAFTPLGGAYGRVPVPATAFGHRRERFLLEHVATIDAGVVRASQTPGATAAATAAKAWSMRSWALAHPWSSGRVYPNFPDPELADWASAYHGSNYARLLAVKRTYDPDNVFSFEQSLRS